MSSRIVTTVQEQQALIKFIESHQMPFTITIVLGKKRTNKQNRLQRKLCDEISVQKGDETPEDIRGFNKLTIGVPIMRSANEIFCEKYDRIIKPLPYEQKLEMMMEPLDFPVTRLMNTKEKTIYLEGIYKYWTSKGFILSQPDDQGR